MGKLSEGSPVAFQIPITSLEFAPYSNDVALQELFAFLATRDLDPSQLLYRGFDGSRIPTVLETGTDRDDGKAYCVDYDWFRIHRGVDLCHPISKARLQPNPTLTIYDKGQLIHHVGYEYIVPTIAPQLYIHHVLSINPGNHPNTNYLSNRNTFW